MAANACPSCGGPIAPADLNMAEGVGLCRACGKLSRLSDIAVAAEEKVEVAAPEKTPQGCELIDRGAGGVLVRATLRSMVGSIALGFFTLFWNGIVSVFLVVVIAGWYGKLIGPPPAWFPSPSVSSSGGPSKTASQMGTGELIFMSLFLTPFVLIGTGLCIAWLTCMFGSVRVDIRGERAKVRTGVGPLSIGKTFDPLNVKSVGLRASPMQKNGRETPQIVVEADKDVRFGSGLTPERRAWMVSTLRTILVLPRR